MIVMEYTVVALILMLALTYLLKAFRPNSKPSGCGCGNTNCRVPKPKARGKDIGASSIHQANQN